MSTHTHPTLAESAPRRTLLAGCGRVATRLGESLVADGGEVVALRRHIEDLPAAFTALAVDLLKPVAQELPGVDAMVITLSPGMGGEDRPTGYLDGLTHLARALPAVPERVVFVSSTRVFEGRPGEQVITEATPPAPTSPRGRLLVEAEHLAVELFNAHIVRPAGIYGPGREMMIRKVTNHTPVQYAQRTNRIHEVDLARALEVMLTHTDPPHILHAVDQSPAPMGEVVTFIADRLGLQPPPAIEPEEAGGTVLGGDLLVESVGALMYPTFREGYQQVINAKRAGC